MPIEKAAVTKPRLVLVGDVAVEFAQPDELLQKIARLSGRSIRSTRRYIRRRR